MEPRALKFYLEEIKKVKNSNFILREGTPFNILVSSLINKNIITSSVVSHYLETLKFPYGCNSKQIFKRKKETYLPLVKVKVSDETISGELDIFTNAAYDLLNTNTNDIKPCIEIALMEIFNNIRSHSKADKIKYIAQRWNDEYLEIAIYDNGVGFKETLHTLNEKDALENAVFKKKSCTGKENRGWGLQTLKVLVLNDEIKGEFLLVSNDNYCYVSKTGKKIDKKFDKFDFNIKGSMIILRLNNLTKSDFNVIYDIMLEPDEYVYKNNLLN